MSDQVYETEKRMDLAGQEADKFKDVALGILLAGSVAYAPDVGVTEDSDVDILVVVPEIKQVVDRAISDPAECAALQNRFFEGYCVRHVVEGVPVSTHVLSADAFDIISKCFVANIRVYRRGPKTGSYLLNNFEGRGYNYTIKNIDLADLPGVRTIVPISFINDDRYFIGLHRDKLLSNPLVLHEREGYAGEHLDKLWRVVVANLHDESMRLHGELRLDSMNILNALARRDRMNPAVVRSIDEKTREYLGKIR